MSSKTSWLWKRFSPLFVFIALLLGRTSDSVLPSITERITAVQKAVHVLPVSSRDSLLMYAQWGNWGNWNNWSNWHNWNNWNNWGNWRNF